MKSPILALTLLLPAAHGCVGLASNDYGYSDAQSSGTELASNRAQDGSRSSWRLFPGDEDESPRLVLEETVIVQIPRIGVTTRIITPEIASKIGVEPFSGVWVESATAQRPAAEAGLRQGDVILAVNDQPVRSTGQLSERISEFASGDQPLELRVLVRNRADELDNGERTFSITPTFTQSEESNSESYAVERAEGVLKYTGLEVAILRPDAAASVYGSSGPAFVVSGVVTGSPAYHSGLRAGDRLLSVDSEPVDSLQGLSDAVLGLVRRADPTAPLYDLRYSASSSFPVIPESQDSILIEVDGPLGPHRAGLEITLDLNDRSDVSIPILFNYESSRTYHESGFLNFIFTFGYDYERTLSSSATRAKREYSSLSILPLGLIQRERRPGNTEWRLLWFISWDA